MSEGDFQPVVEADRVALLCQGIDLDGDGVPDLRRGRGQDDGVRIGGQVLGPVNGGDGRLGDDFALGAR